MLGMMYAGAALRCRNSRGRLISGQQATPVRDGGGVDIWQTSSCRWSQINTIMKLRSHTLYTASSHTSYPYTTQCPRSFLYLLILAPFALFIPPPSLPVIHLAIGLVPAHGWSATTGWSVSTGAAPLRYHHRGWSATTGRLERQHGRSATVTPQSWVKRHHGSEPLWRRPPDPDHPRGILHCQTSGCKSRGAVTHPRTLVQSGRDTYKKR